MSPFGSLKFISPDCCANSNLKKAFWKPLCRSGHMQGRKPFPLTAVWVMMLTRIDNPQASAFVDMLFNRLVVLTGCIETSYQGLRTKL